MHIPFKVKGKFLNIPSLREIFAMYNFCNENKSNKPESQQSNFGIFTSHKKESLQRYCIKK